MDELSNVPKLGEFEIVVSKILGVTSRLIGVTVFIMLLYGGFQYLTAQGDPKKAEQASNIIKGAVLGIVIVIGGWFLINLLEQITGANITVFNICIAGQGANCNN